MKKFNWMLIVFALLIGWSFLPVGIAKDSSKVPISTQGEEIDPGVLKSKPTKQDKLEDKQRRNYTKNYFKQKKKMNSLLNKKEKKEKKINYLEKRLDKKQNLLNKFENTEINEETKGDEL